MNNDMKGPLAGVRVLDLTRVLAGPWCTQCLADLGAEVLKVEAAGEGDETRGWGPPYFHDEAAYFSCANRSKRSLVLDLKSEGGQQKIRALAACADILIENFKLGTMERFGLGYDDLSTHNPRLIYCSISGYGRDGPEASRAGYDFVIQAESGLMSVTGFPDGTPTRVGVAVSDLFTGLYASQAILAALHDQRRSGRGRRIDAALFDCQMAALANIQANALATGIAPARYGNAHANVVPYEAFETTDGLFVVALGNTQQFRTLCGIILDDPDLADDPRFCDNASRVEHRAELSRRLAAHFSRHPRSHWQALFHESQLPGGILRTVDEALDTPHVAARGLIHSFDEGKANEVKVVRYPLKISGGMPDPVRPPKLGEGGAELAENWLLAAPQDWDRCVSASRNPEQAAV